jgi:hypothetical protein
MVDRTQAGCMKAWSDGVPLSNGPASTLNNSRVQRKPLGATQV